MMPVDTKIRFFGGGVTKLAKQPWQSFDPAWAYEYVLCPRGLIRRTKLQPDYAFSEWRAGDPADALLDRWNPDFPERPWRPVSLLEAEEIFAKEE